MKRLLAVEHVRVQLLLIYAVAPVVAAVFWLLTGAGPAASLLPVAAAMLVVWGMGAFVVLRVMGPQRYVEELAELEAGRGWARWSYDEAQWASAVAAERARQQRLNRPTFVALGVAGGVAVVVALVTEVSTLFAVGFTGLLVLVGAATWLVLWLGAGGPAARRARAGEVLVGRLGVLRRPGTYAAFAPAGALTGVELLGTAPMRIVFTATRLARPPWAYWIREQMADLVVPAGRADEARALVERFHREVLSRR
ncbi:hypothetical protein ACQEVZ_51395 [Dactylosporangium sp. CA-152071]|uniref:hypothetical protein n=1 Tax=Dactylosporangium sp. CA-152071 TaxID=3239933 RepID=UPI003D8A2564